MAARLLGETRSVADTEVGSGVKRRNSAQERFSLESPCQSLVHRVSLRSPVCVVCVAHCGSSAACWWWWWRVAVLRFRALKQAARSQLRRVDTGPTCTASHMHDRPTDRESQTRSTTHAHTTGPHTRPHERQGDLSSRRISRASPRDSTRWVTGCRAVAAVSDTMHMLA